MIIQQPNTTNRQSNISGFSGFNERELTVDDLLNAAIAEGGALGDAAMKLQNPGETFYKRFARASMSTLSGLIHTIQTPLYAVAGVMDPNKSVKETVSEGITPGDLLLERPDEYANFLEKSKYHISKFAVDTLLDPLTYLTFGAGRGVLGLTMGAEAIAGKNLGKELMKSEGSRVYLSEAGEELADKYYQSQLKGLRQTFLTEERTRMVSQGVDKDEIAARLAALEKDTSNELIKRTLESPIDKKKASQAVANLLEKRPDLAAKYIDKGGIKFFGKSILSSQRISSVKAIIPGMTALDNAMSAARATVGGMFSTKYSNGVRLSDAYLDEADKWRYLVEAKKGQLAIQGARMKQQLGLTGEEWDFITAAVEHNLKPRDPKAADIYNLIHGVAPEHGTIRDEVWQGMIGVKKLNKATRKELLDAGLKVSDFKNYMPHLLVDNKISETPFKKTDRVKFAGISVLIDEQGKRIPTRLSGKPDKTGEVSGKMLVDGQIVEKDFRVVYAEKETAQIQEEARRLGKEILTDINKLKDEITTVKTDITTKISENVVDQIRDLISDVKALTTNEQSTLAKIVSDFVETNDINKLVNQHISDKYQNGIRIKGEGEISAPDIQQIIKDAVAKDASAKEIAAAMKEKLRPLPSVTTGVQSTKQAKTKAGKSTKILDTEKDIFKLAEEIKKQAMAGREAVLRDGINTDAVRQLVSKTIDEFSSNPVGLSRALDKIFKNSQVIKELGEEIVDLSRSVQLEKDRVEKLAGKYVSDTGKVFTRDRATIQEARKLGVDFEQNALVTSLIASDDAIRFTASRHFARDIAKKFGKKESEAPDDWVPIEQMGTPPGNVDLEDWLSMDRAINGVVADDGERILFPPEIAKHIATVAKGFVVDDGSRTFFKAYDSLQNWFKAAVTSIFPAFHGRNALSNVFLMYNKIGVEALNPATHVATANILNMERQTANLARKAIKDVQATREFSGLMTKKVFTDSTGYTWTWGELRSQLHNNVVAFHHKNLGQTDQLHFSRSEVREAAANMFPKTVGGKMKEKIKPLNPFDMDNALFKGGFKIGQTIEDYSRTLAFLSQLKGTGDPIQAARVTKLALFDYTNLTNFERSVLRRLFPFYSFTRKNLELQVNTLLTNPGKIAQEIRAVQTLGDVFSGETLTDEERSALPEWAIGGYEVVTNREGSHITLLRALGTPLEETFSRMSGQENISMLSPLVKAPLEFMSGYSFFHGRPISEVTNADVYQFAPEYIKEFIGLEEVKYTDKQGNEQTYFTSFDPQRMWLLNNIQPTGRFFSEANRIDKSPDPVAKFNALMFGFGAREFNLDYERDKRIKENREALIKILEQGGVGYTFTRYIPETTNSDSFEGF
jgi:hypothetical protein